VSDPDDAETGFTPAAADFNGLAGRGQEPDAVETRAILAEIDGVGALGERMAFGVDPFDDDAKSLWDAWFLAFFFPEVGDRLLKRETDASFAVGIGVKVDDADFLLLAAALVDEKNRVAQGEFGLQGDKSNAGIDEDGFGVFVESAPFAGKAVNHHGNAHGDAFAGTWGFLSLGRRKGHGIRYWSLGLGWGIVDGGDFHGFLRNALLRAMFAALEFPGLLEDLLEGFLAVRKGDPGVAVSFRAPEADGKVPRH